jgi:protein-arginine kinase activator protein McsA
MVVKEFRCQQYGHRFIEKVLDRQNPREENKLGSALRCPNCNTTFVEVIRTLRRAS